MAKQLKSKRSREDRAEIRRQLEWVAEQLNFIEASSTFDDGGDEAKQRIVLSLPRSLVRLVRFLALMDTEASPTSQRRIDAMMRRYLEGQIYKQSFASLNRMYSDVQD